MCVITDKQNKVLGVFLIPGTYDLGDVNVYFPYNGDLPMVGTEFTAVKDNRGIWTESN